MPACRRCRDGLGGHTRWRDQLQAALLGLGWSAPRGRRGRRARAPDAAEASAAGGEPDVAALLKVALRSLSKA